MENINLENAILYADSSRGVYIPQYFAESIKRECVSGYCPVKWAVLRHGPEDEFYWEDWTHILDNTTVTDPDTGIEYGLWQNGDLWLVPFSDLYASDFGGY